MACHSSSLQAFISIVLGFSWPSWTRRLSRCRCRKYSNTMVQTLKQYSWVINAYNIAFAVFLITGSRIADQFGRKTCFYSRDLYIYAHLFSLRRIAIGTLAYLFPRCSGHFGGASRPGLDAVDPETFFAAAKRRGCRRMGRHLRYRRRKRSRSGGIITEYFQWQWIFISMFPSASSRWFVLSCSSRNPMIAPPRKK